jgi:hypothetical protein
MNMHVHPGISGAALPCVFKVGDFVRIKGSANTGRITEVAENEDYPIPYTVCVFGDPNTENDFAAGQLEMWRSWTVQQPLDLEKAEERLMKIISLSELLEDLGRLEANNDADVGKPGHFLPYHLQLIGSIVSDVACDLLDMIEIEGKRRRQ